MQATTGGLLQGLSDDALAVQQSISEKVSLQAVYSKGVAGPVVAVLMSVGLCGHLWANFRCC